MCNTAVLSQASPERRGPRRVGSILAAMLSAYKVSARSPDSPECLPWAWMQHRVPGEVTAQLYRPLPAGGWHPERLSRATGLGQDPADC